MAEFDEAAVGQDGRLVDPLAVDVGVGVRVAWSERRDPVGVGDDAMTRLDMGAVQLKGDAVGGTHLEQGKSCHYTDDISWFHS